MQSLQNCPGYRYEPMRGLTLWGAKEDKAALDVLRSRSPFRYYGPDLLHRTDGFERDFAARMGADFAVAVSSGTAALACGLIGMGMPEGAEVVLPAVTFVACVNAVIWARGVPVFADIDASLCLDPAALEGVLSERVWGVMPVHLAQAAADLDPILALCRDRGVRVLEDAAQAAGATYHGRPVGGLGDAGAFSFQLEKNITAGEGGALVTNDPEVYDRVRRYQDQGGQFTTGRGATRGEGGGAFLGVNLRMSEVAAAILSVQLERLDPMLVRLRAVAARVKSELADLSPAWRPVADEAGTAGDLTVLTESRITARRLVDGLAQRGIPARVPYGGRTVCLEPAVREARTAWGRGFTPPARMPVSERIVGRAVTVDLGAAMTDDDVDYLVRSLREELEPGAASSAAHRPEGGSGA
jgi:8-amino-3,8-dideoxy-alpha-D-manno-octulosonate transaminase